MQKAYCCSLLPSTSEFYKLSAGVRQGGVLSPFLFGIYVDNVMAKLASSGLVCFMKCNCFNSIMYADDLIILSISLHHLQSLVNICVHEFKSIRMSINLLKSACLRVGPRHAAVCQPITIEQVPLKWVQEIKYLGIYLLSGKSFPLICNQLNKSFLKH